MTSRLKEARRGQTSYTRERKESDPWPKKILLTLLREETHQFPKSNMSELMLPGNFYPATATRKNCKFFEFELSSIKVMGF